MKRTGNLYETICSFENCKQAILKASKRKRKRRNVQKILQNLDEYAERLSNMLREHKYDPSPYSVRWINDGIKQKRRKLAKPRFWPDQCVHHALDNVTAPIFTKGMYYYCTGSVKGRGCARSKKGIEKFIRKYPKKAQYVFKMDIKKYYDTISHKKLIQTIKRYIKDPEVIWPYQSIINSFPAKAATKEENFTKEELERGIPIGIDPSRWLCNLLLQPLDHAIKHFLGKGYFMTRYVDDIVVIGPNKRKLHKLRKFIDEYLKHMGQCMKENWQVFRLEKRPIDFLGYKFYKDRTTIRKTLLKRIKRKIKKISKMKKVSFRNAAGMISYMGWVKHSNSVHFRNKYIKNKISIKRLRKVVKNEGIIYRETQKNMA